MKEPTLDKVLTIRQVAQLAGWKRDRMYLHLMKLNQELNGMLLHRAPGRGAPWTVTLRALRAVAPAWFLDSESITSQLEELDDRVTEAEGDIERLKKITTLHTDHLERLDNSD